MGQVISFIRNLLSPYMVRSSKSAKSDQTPPPDHHDQLTVPLQPESHLVIDIPGSFPARSHTDSEIESNNNASSNDCLVLDLSSITVEAKQGEDEEQMVLFDVHDHNRSSITVEANQEEEEYEEIVLFDVHDQNQEHAGDNSREVPVDVVVEKSMKPKKKKKERKEVLIKTIGQYASNQKILLVGEGDFSFSASLAVAFGSASNMVATSFNFLDFLLKNYGNFSTNKKELETRGCLILHGVDATKMAKHPRLSGMKFNRIVFNFPHAGKFGRSESEIRQHQNLVRGFLKNAKKMIEEEDSEIHVTHKSNGFFLQWDIPKLGTDQGLTLIQEIKFNRSKYPGYHTKYGFGGDKDFECSPCKTYKFALASK